MADGFVGETVRRVAVFFLALDVLGCGVFTIVHHWWFNRAVVLCALWNDRVQRYGETIVISRLEIAIRHHLFWRFDHVNRRYGSKHV